MSKNLYNKIVARFIYLDKYVRYLKELQKASRLEFLNNWRVFGTTERYFQLSIDVMIDIGKMIIAAREMEHPEENKYIFDVLLSNKVITKTLYEKINGIVGFRNLLVHEYTKIDLEMVYTKLHGNIPDFVIYKKQVLKYLDSL